MQPWGLNTHKTTTQGFHHSMLLVALLAYILTPESTNDKASSNADYLNDYAAFMLQPRTAIALSL